MEQKITIQYLASLVDGEGCIDFEISKNKSGIKKTPRLRVALVEEDSLVLFLIQKQYGGKIYHVGNGKAWKANWKQQKIWYIRSKDCIKILKELIPYLIVKKNRAKEISGEIQ